MRLYLAKGVVPRMLEAPCLYHIGRDELYELDSLAFHYVLEAAADKGADPTLADHEFVGYCLEEGLLSYERTVQYIGEIVQAPTPSLRYLELQITDSCNLRCSHCYIGEPSSTELSVESINAVLGEFQSMQGLRLLITGGEPLIHSRFEEINRALKDYPVRKILFTNGLLLTADRIKDLNVDEIQISIDGMLKGHEAIRGAGTYEQAIKGMYTALESGLPVSVSTMIHKENLDEFEDMQQLLRSAGIKDWTVDAPCPEGRLRQDNSISCDAKTGGRIMGYGWGAGLHGSQEGFGCGLHLAAVLSNGNIAKCAFYADRSVGHIRDGLAAAWRRIEPVMLADLECASAGCEYLEECRGGCRYRASVMSQSPAQPSSGSTFYSASPDFYKCYYYGIM